jgi:hypothetical protein
MCLLAKRRPDLGCDFLGFLASVAEQLFGLVPDALYQFATPSHACVTARARRNTKISEPRERLLFARGTHAIVALVVTRTGGFSKAFSVSKFWWV